MGSLINKKHVKEYILYYTKERRLGWKCTRVSKEALDMLDYKLKCVIDRAIKAHPSKGKTFVEII